MIQALLYKGTKRENASNAQWLDRLICWWTDSRFSHVEFVERLDAQYATTWSASPRDKRVRSTIIDMSTGRWVLIELPGDHDATLAWFKAHAGALYDWLGVSGHVLGFMRRLSAWFTPTRTYCSKALATAAGYARRDCTPEDIYQLRIEKGTQ